MSQKKDVILTSRLHPDWHRNSTATRFVHGSITKNTSKGDIFGTFSWQYNHSLYLQLLTMFPFLHFELWHCWNQRIAGRRNEWVPTHFLTPRIKGGIILEHTEEQLILIWIIVCKELGGHLGVIRKTSWSSTRWIVCLWYEWDVIAQRMWDVAWMWVCGGEHILSSTTLICATNWSHELVDSLPTQIKQGIVS